MIIDCKKQQNSRADYLKLNVTDDGAPELIEAIPYSNGKLVGKIGFLVLIFKIPVLGPIGGVFPTVSEN